MNLDFTHDPHRRSWVESANDPACDFPLQNLPHGVFRPKGAQLPGRGGVAIGDAILDLGAAVALQLFPPELQATACRAAAPTLNGFMAQGRPAWRALRAELSRQLALGSHTAAALASCLVPQRDADMLLPAHIGDYTDFFTSHAHMVNMGRLFQPDKPALPQFDWLPIAYHGRASTVEVSGAAFQRPWGQRRGAGSAAPVFAPTQALDYEVELGAWVGPGNARGEPIGVDAAEDRLFGLCLLNDWSARDIQGFESLPLGPFQAKNFLTTVSPWIVTLEALAPYRCAVQRPPGAAPLPDYLMPRAGLERAGVDILLEARLATAASGADTMRLSLGNGRHGAWGFAQMLAHHSVNGCAMAPGDLLGSGTQSGPGPGEQGCLMELTQAGAQPITLPTGERRAMLEDGDAVILRGWCKQPGRPRIGFGECRGTVLPARQRGS